MRLSVVPTGGVPMLKYAISLAAAILLMGCEKAPSTSPLIEDQGIDQSKPSWTISQYAEGYCQADSLWDEVQITVIPNGGTALVTIKDQRSRWNSEAGFTVMLGKHSALASMRMRAPDGTLVLSRNNTMNFEIPTQVLEVSHTQLDLYDFQSGEFIKSYSFANSDNLLKLIKSCSVGPVPQIKWDGQLRTPERSLVVTSLPKTEGELFDALSGKGSSNPSFVSSRWEFNQGSPCIAIMQNEQARFMIAIDEGEAPIGNFSVFVVQNKDKILTDYVPMQLRINGIESPVDEYKIPPNGSVPYLRSTYFTDNLETDQMTVELFERENNMAGQLWDKFVISPPKNLRRSLENCKQM